MGSAFTPTLKKDINDLTAAENAGDQAKAKEIHNKIENGLKKTGRLDW